VRNLIAFLNSIGADIHLNVDHSIVMKPSKIVSDHKEFTIIADYIEAGTYFAI
jgi:UDP-N-acetylglucosamine enolpyruvyl transferase